MKNKIFIMLLAIVLFAVPGAIVNANNAKQLDLSNSLTSKDYKKGELLVVFNEGTSDRTIDKIVDNSSGTLDEIIKITDDNKVATVDVPKDASVSEVINELDNNPKVLIVQRNYKYHFYQDSSSVPSPSSSTVFLRHVNAREAWSLVESGDYTTTKVGVIDTGVDLIHEDLTKNLVSNDNYTIFANGKKTTAYDDVGEHGTHVTGIIGADNDDKGMTGVASGTNNDLVEILPIGASFDGMYLYTSDIVEAINYAKENNVKVINMSFGSEARDRVLEKAVKDAYDEGIVLVAASGNEESNSFSSPSSFKEVISVNASNRFDKPAYFSDYGIFKDVTAPGVSIYSTVPGDEYEFFSGTSMASPVVAGVVALMLDANPDLTPSEVYNILAASTKKVNFANPDAIFDDYLAYGIVNAENAVRAAKEASSDVEVTDLFVKPSTISLDEGDTFSFESMVKPATSLKKVTWSIDDNSVADIDSVTGKVTAKAAGNTTVKATVGSEEVSVSVNVKETVKPSGIQILNKSTYMLKGDKKALKVGILPANVSNSEVIFTSSDNSIAFIDDYGDVNAVKEGEVTITVTTYDESYSDSMTIQVIKPADKIAYSTGGYATKMLQGNTFTYRANLVDEDGVPLPIKNSLEWSSTNSKVAKIDKDTGEVQALAPGVTYIKAIASDIDNYSASFDRVIKLTVGKQDYSKGDYGLKVYKKTYNSVTLKWNKISVAGSYIIERSEKLNGPYQKIATVSSSSTQYVNKNLSIGKVYYYRIKATYTTTKHFSYSWSVKASIVPNTPSISKVVKYNSKSLKISWGKVPLATGYYLYRSNSYNGPYYLVKNVTSASYINSNLKKNKKYYYKLRAYKTVGSKKIFSSYSTVKSGIIR